MYTLLHTGAYKHIITHPVGTTSDRFLRENLEWLSRATNWAKFTATASLGVIHRGHETQALNLMSTYLPKDSTSSSSYSEVSSNKRKQMVPSTSGSLLLN